MNILLQTLVKVKYQILAIVALAAACAVAAAADAAAVGLGPLCVVVAAGVLADSLEL